MIHIISVIAVTILSIAGLTEIIRLIICCSFRKQDDNIILLICPITNENAEYTLRCCTSKAVWMGKPRPDRIIFAGENLNKNTQKIFNSFRNQHEYIEVMTPAELCSLISEIKQHNISYSE